MVKSKKTKIYDTNSVHSVQNNIEILKELLD